MRNKATRWWTLCTATLALCLIALPVRAADDDDPPARAARLSYAQGAVSFEPAGTDEWVDAAVNRPMTTGDLWGSDQDAGGLRSVSTLAHCGLAPDRFSF
jgi:hypothetical protein